MSEYKAGYPSSMPSAPPPNQNYPPVPSSGNYPPPYQGVCPPPQGGPYPSTASPFSGPCPPGPMQPGMSCPPPGNYHTEAPPAYSQSNQVSYPGQGQQMYYPPPPPPPKTQQPVAASGGLFSDISRGVGSLVSSVVNVTDQVAHGDVIITKLRARNVVQLYSKRFQTTLQAVVSPYGQLVVDSRGPRSPQAYHAHWTVYKENGNILKFFNQNNYIGAVNGTIGIINNPTQQTPMTRFRVRQYDKGITIESLGQPGCYFHVTKENELVFKEGYQNAEVFYIDVVFWPQ